MSLVARYLEAAGIPTVCLGSAYDIFTAGRPPRAVFVDYPLGHSAGKPFELDDRLAIITASLEMFECPEPGTLRVLPNQWGTLDDWRQSAGATDGNDTRQPRDETPQFQLPADQQAAVMSGALAR